MKIEKYINDFYTKNIKNREFIIIIILIFILALGKQIFIIIRFFAVWILLFLITMRLTNDNQKSLITATLLTLILYILGNLYDEINIFEGFNNDNENSELKNKVKDMPMDKNEMNDEITKLLGLKELSGDNDREEDNESSIDDNNGDEDSDFDNISDVSSNSDSDNESESEIDLKTKKKKKAIMSKKRVQRQTFSLMKQIQNTLKDMAPQIKQGEKLMKQFDKLKLDNIEIPEIQGGIPKLNL
jgi:hypothetical protein